MSLSKREVTLIIILLALISGGGYYNFYYLPKSAQIMELRRDIAEKREEVEAAVARVVQYGALMKRKEGIMDRWGQAVTPIPRDFDDADVLRRVQQAVGPYSGDIGVRFSDKDELLEKTRIHIVDIGFTATYSQLLRILENFSNKAISNRILDLRYTEINREGPEPLLNVHIQAEYHTFN